MWEFSHSNDKKRCSEGSAVVMHTNSEPFFSHWASNAAFGLFATKPLWAQRQQFGLGHRESAFSIFSSIAKVVRRAKKTLFYCPQDSGLSPHDVLGLRFRSRLSVMVSIAYRHWLFSFCLLFFFVWILHDSVWVAHWDFGVTFRHCSYVLVLVVCTQRQRWIQKAM